MKIKIHLQIAATYIGAVVGAGFASGQEIMQFFVPFGRQAYWGTVMVTLLFILLGMTVLRLAMRRQFNSYQEIVGYLLGPRLGRVVDGFLSLFLFLGLCIMLAGSGAIFAEHLDGPAGLGIGLAVLCLAVVLTGEVKGLVWFNSLLVPVKFLLCLGVCLAAVWLTPGGPPLISPASPGLNPVSSSWIWASLLYVSYNLVLGMVVLASLGPYAERAGNTLGAVLGGVGLGVFALAIIYALQVNYPAVAEYEVPMLYVAALVHPGLKYLYGIILWLGILTTAVANAYGFAQRLAALSRLSYRTCLGLTLLAAIPFAQFSFADLIQIVYPFFGYVGLALMAGLVFKLRRIW